MSARQIVGLEEHLVTEPVLAAWRDLEPRWQDLSLADTQQGRSGHLVAATGAERLAAMDEAGVDVQALWRAWEALRLDATTGMSVWWRDHADHHLPILLSPDGPFARCAARAHQTPPIPYPPTPPHPTGGYNAPMPEPTTDLPAHGTDPPGPTTSASRAGRSCHPA